MEEQAYSRQDTERILLDAVEALRAHPEKYREVHRAIREARSDEERVRQLLNFATSDQEIAALLPASAAARGEPRALAWTTVTVTTIFIPDTAY